MLNAMHQRSLERALATVAAIGITAAVGLGAMDPSADTVSRRLPADANAQRVPGVPMPMPQSIAPQGRGEVDPALNRVESGADQHG